MGLCLPQYYKTTENNLDSSYSARYLVDFIKLSSYCDNLKNKIRAIKLMLLLIYLIINSIVFIVNADAISFY